MSTPYIIADIGLADWGRKEIQIGLQISIKHQHRQGSSSGGVLRQLSF